MLAHDRELRAQLPRRFGHQALLTRHRAELLGPRATLTRLDERVEALLQPPAGAVSAQGADIALREQVLDLTRTATASG